MSYKGFVGPVGQTDPFYDSWCRARLTRILSNTKADEKGCLIWQRRADDAGYARTSPFRGTTLVHRQVWLLSGYLIPAGLELDHLCHVRNCLNVDHLRCVTHAENMANRKYKADSLRCRQGHLKKVAASGKSYCYVCTRKAVKAWQKRNPQKARDLWNRSKRARRAKARLSDKKIAEQQEC